MKRALSAAVIVASAAAARADGFLVFQDDRAGFQASLDVGPLSTVIDSGGAFAPNPAAATNLASVTRSGSIAGGAYTWVGYDVNFSNAPTGHLTPGVAGGDISSTSPLDVETPASQGAAVGSGTWGLDGGSGGPTTRNALLVNFTATPGGLGIGHFGRPQALRTTILNGFSALKGLKPSRLRQTRWLLRFLKSRHDSSPTVH